MSFIKKIGVFFLSILAILLLIILSFSFTLSSFLYPQVYFDAFEAAGMYEYLGDNLENAPNMFIQIPPTGARSLIETLFSNFLSYMRSDADTLNLEVTIDKEKIRNFFLSSVGNLSECRQGQDPFNEENPCLPRGQSADEFLDSFLESKGLNFFEESTVDLTEVYGIEVGSEQRKSLDNLRNYIAYYKALKIILIVLILIMISLIFLLQQPNTKKSLRTAGLIFIVPAIILFFISLSINKVDQYIQIPDPIFGSMIDVVKTVLSNNLLFYSGVIGALGLALFISSFLIKQKTSLSTDKKKQIKKKV